jgi:hypothetical protein
VVVTVVGVLGERADGDEQQVVWAKIDSAFQAVPAPVEAGRLFASGCDVKINIGHLSPILEMMNVEF